MNLDEWKHEVDNHNKIVSTILSDRRILKEHMNEYLHRFFEFRDIEFSTDLHIITLSFDYDDDIRIPDNIKDFAMDWSIDFSHDEIRIYPFGKESDD